MKVYLLAGQFPFYADQIRYPPDGVEYLPRHLGTSGQTMTSYYSSVTYQMKRRVASLLLTKLKLPVVAYRMNHHSDLIYSTRGILILNRMPWLMDIDYVGYFFGGTMFSRELMKASRLKSIVNRMLSSDNCKKIICWSEAGQRSVMSTFGASNEINAKTEVVYPAIAAPVLTERERKGSHPVRLLYVSSSFGPKGGEQVLLAFERLLEYFDDIELVFKCDVPERARARHDRNEIRYFPYRDQLLPHDELLRTFYMKSDVFVYPTFGDLFGLNLLDALAAELPVVTTNTFAIPEIIEDGRNGFLIDLPDNWHDENYLSLQMDDRNKPSQESRAQFVESLVEKLAKIIEDSSLRTSMGKRGRELIESGKFSLAERNAKLKNIYEEAVVR
jgi:glycosyltransferase involved in cell wall biosynthesis